MIGDVKMLTKKRRTGRSLTDHYRPLFLALGCVEKVKVVIFLQVSPTNSL